eukprot:134202_1
MSLLLLIFCLVFQAFSQLNITIKYNVSCGDVITETIKDEPAAHYYQFSINTAYYVNFEDCDSSTDMKLQIADNMGYDISYEYCNDMGDDCGVCKNDAEYPENFTMPMVPDIYFIGIGPYDIGGTYQLKVNCFPISVSDTASNNCDHYNKANYSIIPSQKVVDVIIDTNKTFEIRFDIKLNNYCNASLCNILSILDKNNYEALSLFIDVSPNELIISISNDSYIYVINNANTILPTDSKYHHIHLLYGQDLNAIENNVSMIKIDNSTFYYRPVIYPLLLPQIYGLYFSNSYDEAVNASVTNICLNGVVIIEGELRCGDILEGSLRSPTDIIFYYFNSLKTGYVSFDSCYSSFDTWLFLFNLSGHIIHQANDDGFCFPKAQLNVDPLTQGEYVLGISGDDDYGKWELEVFCDTDVTLCNNVNDYNISDLSYILISCSNRWFDAELMCEKEFGTTLATIIDEEDLIDAMMDINEQFTMQASVLDEQKYNISIWIGMYRDLSSVKQWKWIDGSVCDYMSTNNCFDDLEWKEKNSTDQQLSSVLFIPEVTNNNSISSFDAIPIDGSYSTHSFMALCNGPVSKYSVQQCSNKLQCWHLLDCCNDVRLNSDIEKYSSLYVWQPPTAYWNTTIFVVGVDEIHFANIPLLNDEIQWRSQLYNNNEDTIYVGSLTIRRTVLSPRYAQYKSSLYLWQFTSASDVLMHINLNNLQISYTSVSDGYPSLYGSIYEARFCIVADENNVYIVKQNSIIMYNINSNSWSDVSIQNNLIPITCAITNNYQFIYIFGYKDVGDLSVTKRFIIKYVIDTTETIQLNSTNLCMVPKLILSNVKYQFVQSITAANGKMYLHGCYYASWKTLIFNPVIDEFETNTVDIDMPNKNNIPFYRSSQLTTMNDNILLLFQKRNSESNASLYFTITNIVSINLEETTPQIIWPSD